MSVPKVLIIDSNDYHAGLLRSQLVALGYEVVHANRGQQGVMLATKNPPDLILMDSFLPDQTGFQICTQLRRNRITQTVPIVLMSGIAHFPNQQMFAMERGATAYISKPLVTIEVGDIVDKYISWKPETAAPPVELKPKSETLSLPPVQENYTLSTDIHSALSARLQQALEENKDRYNS